MATTPRTLSDEHKKALAEGRVSGKIVNQYLDALDQHKPKKGRQVTPAELVARIAKVDEKLARPETRGSARLELVQEKLDLEERLSRLSDTSAIDELEKQFVEVAKPYAERKGFTPEAFRQVGVPNSVLKAAGLI